MAMGTCGRRKRGGDSADDATVVVTVEMDRVDCVSLAGGYAGYGTMAGAGARRRPIMAYGRAESINLNGRGRHGGPASERCGRASGERARRRCGQVGLRRYR